MLKKEAREKDAKKKKDVWINGRKEETKQGRTMKGNKEGRKEKKWRKEGRCKDGSGIK